VIRVTRTTSELCLLCQGQLEVVADHPDGDTQGIVLVTLLLEDVLHLGELLL
jgi:hypothetical protein